MSIKQYKLYESLYPAYQADKKITTNSLENIYVYMDKLALRSNLQLSYSMNVFKLDNTLDRQYNVLEDSFKVGSLSYYKAYLKEILKLPLDYTDGIKAVDFIGMKEGNRGYSSFKISTIFYPQHKLRYKLCLAPSVYDKNIPLCDTWGEVYNYLYKYIFRLDTLNFKLVIDKQGYLINNTSTSLLTLVVNLEKNLINKDNYKDIKILIYNVVTHSEIGVIKLYKQKN